MGADYWAGMVIGMLLATVAIIGTFTTIAIIYYG